MVLPRQDGALVVLIDASGHGLSAYAVAQKARNVTLNSSSDRPDSLLNELHEALQGTVGAAISIARIRPGAIDHAAVGNIQTSIDLSPLMTQAGIVGSRMRSPKMTTASFEVGQWLLMHTDGVSRPDSLPNGNAETVAEKLMDLYGSDHDDAGIVLLRVPEGDR